jgi:PST family polysaccharide transporter/lipopolysaccharide exporter
VADRLPFSRDELGRRTVRGVAINATFLLVVEAVALAQGLIVARLLGPREVGLYGIVSITATTLIALKRVGIDEAFVQQDEADQEAEFQRAFTLELALACLFALLIAIAAPIVAAAYGEERLLPLTLAVAYLPIAFALQAPLWIFFRRMDFIRQRSLQAVVPLTTFAVTVPLVVAGVGVWSLVIGAFAGNVASAILAIRLSPYRLGLRLDRATARRYLAFSWPIFVVTACGLVMAQGQIFAFDLKGGLQATGFVALAVALTRYADRADSVISPAIYPAVCAVRDQSATLERLFSAAARASAIWSLMFGALFVLFAPDLVAFVLGHEWDGAVPLLQGLAASGALYYLGFTWIAFARGLGRPRPPALEAVAALAVFAFVALPLLSASGTTAYVLAMVGSSLVVLVVRTVFLRRLLPGVALGRLAARALWPLLAAAGAALALRLALWGGTRTAGQAAAELVLFLGVYAATTWAAERDLVREMRETARARPPEPAPQP